MEDENKQVNSPEWNLYNEGNRIAIRTDNWGVTLPTNYEKDARLILAAPVMADALIEVYKVIGDDYYPLEKEMMVKVNKALVIAGIKK